MAVKEKSINEKLFAKVVEFSGLPERKAKDLAQMLGNTVRAIVKAEVKKAEAKKAEAKIMAEQYQPGSENDSKEIEPSNAVKEVGPSNVVTTAVGQYDVLPCNAVLAEPLQIQDGRCSSGTYLVLASKGENGIISARKFGREYKVKFFPSVEYWNLTDYVSELGSVYDRPSNNYQGIYPVSEKDLTALVKYVEQQAKPFARFKALAKRFHAAAWKTLKDKFPS